jgi:hypothetical protein
MGRWGVVGTGGVARMSNETADQATGEVLDVVQTRADLQEPDDSSAAR